MNISEETNGDVVILALEGRLDSNTAPEFQEKLIALIGQGKASIVVDFASLDYISSAGLRVLLLGAKKIKGTAHKMVLCGMNDNVQNVFKMSGFDRILTITPGRDEALASAS